MLAHWVLDEMDSILQIVPSNAFLINYAYCISIQNLPKFVPCGTIDNKSQLVQVMIWSLALFEPMLTMTSDTLWRHQVTVCIVILLTDLRALYLNTS